MLVALVILTLLWQVPLLPPQGLVVLPDRDRGNPVWYLIMQTPTPYVDSENHVCWKGYIGVEIPGRDAIVQPNDSCETAAGLAWLKSQPMWAAWLANNDPSPVPFPGT